MKVTFYPSSFNLKKTQKNKLYKALNSFQAMDRLFYCEQDFPNIFDKIQKESAFTAVFVFGGASASSQICQSLGLKTKLHFISQINTEAIDRIQKQTQSTLKKARFVFISKSGKTYESLFYKNLIESLYEKKKISLKDKVFVITEKSKSPLLQWVEKPEAYYLEKNGVPGRFSFFKSIGLLQFQAYGLSPSEWSSKSSFDKLLEFLIFNKEKKEIWLCSMDPKLEAFCQWLEMAWSESLFKTNQTHPPLLRHIRWYDLQHGFIEELAAKKDQICFWALEPLRNQIYKAQKKSFKNLIRSKNLSFLHSQIDLNQPSSLFDLIFLSYKVLFVLSAFFKADIFSNVWVDFLKKPTMEKLS